MTERKPENPRAFPLPVNDRGFAGYEGMTLRDYFAAAALQGWIAMHAATECSLPKADTSAKLAYEMADAMLKARAE